MTEHVDLSLMQAHTIADALVAYALAPTSTDTRIRQVIEALTAVGYNETAEVLDRMQNNRRQLGLVERIEDYAS